MLDSISTESDPDDYAKLFEARTRPALPAEGLVRLFLGDYPNRPGLPKTGKVLDLGCGDGRNTSFLASIGFDAVGVDVSNPILHYARTHHGEAEYLVGSSSNIPIEKNSVEVLVAWNSINYFGHDNANFSKHFGEVKRVVRVGGYVVMSVPMRRNFIFDNSSRVHDWPGSRPGEEYMRIESDPWGHRVGEIIGSFSSEEAIKTSASEAFGGDVWVSSTVSDWFGLDYSWFVVVAQVGGNQGV